ncbi:endonuclease/exonuclease/phosphatase family protein [Arenibacter lacus]|uniref:endonuclease/exonuclease/phosphatase family protein n=1 Tax=Arenibacter lacus TaxID=2608629 RepID=UPI00123CA082|nr:endonuclease/exonuclease/phosphatase family protein [Arenibacter lacus]
MKYTTFILVFFSLVIGMYSQAPKSYQIRTVAFYNVENLFDTHRDSLTFDGDFTPTGKNQWTQERYRKKLDNITQVLYQIGREVTHNAPDIIGLCEIENRGVLEDLIQHPTLRDLDYDIIHFDSPDERGIDVALLYRQSAFLPTSFRSHRLLLTKEEIFRDYTRDQLVVGGLLDGEPLHFIVNHWPSRSGGEARSRPNRIAAARLNKRIIDSIIRQSPDAKIISMGDFNDDPTDYSFKKILKIKTKEEILEPSELYNPMENLYKKGLGTLAYRDRWNLFDQLYFTANLYMEPKSGYRFWKAGIFNPPYLIDPKGQYKGYPLRTYANGNYVGGYSDHFPVYLFLIRPIP